MARKKSKPKKDKKPLFHDLNPHTWQSIWAVVSAGVACVFLLALLDYAGPVGRYIDWTLRALFGAGAWLAPLACVAYIFILLNPNEDDNEVSRSKVFGVILLCVSILALLELWREGSGGLLGLSLEWPLTFLLEGTATAILLVVFMLVSVFLLFNTGLRLWPRREAAESEDTDDDFADLDLPEPETTADDPADETDSADEDEDEAPSSGISAMAKKVSGLKKIKDSEIVVKSFSGQYVPPSLSLLSKEKGKPQIGDVKAGANMIKRTLKEFGINVEMDAVESGPTITRYALKPAQGVKISRIVGLQQELQLALKASSIRIEAPIPGKSLVGIEVPNQVRGSVGLASLLSTPEYTDSPHPLLVALGKDVTGEVHFTNVARMPHGLIAGTTGSGKSVMIHNVIISLLYRNSPDQLRFILVDPKRVEMTLYNKIPHLLTPVITDAKKTIRALSWAVKEMERRYDILQAEGKQNISSYHDTVYKPAKEEWVAAGSDPETQKDLPEALPYIVIILDELNDIMQAYPRELEACIVRLAQMSRAVGIHLLLATQRPSVNVITGTIKANVPSRIAFAVASQVDSRTIIDSVGAEKLLGKGDMLYLSSDSPKPIRLQSAFVSEEEIKKVVDYLKKQDAHELDTINFDEASDNSNDSVFTAMVGGGDDAEDDLYLDAKAAVIEANKASTSYLQRKLRVGYSRAARLMDLLEENGVIGPADGSKPREILASGMDEGQADDTDDETEDDAEREERYT
jgi:S-DNA-T family DNA segregation ATPase FtsK/SpoIIIE